MPINIDEFLKNKSKQKRNVKVLHKCEYGVNIRGVAAVNLKHVVVNMTDQQKSKHNGRAFAGLDLLLGKFHWQLTIPNDEETKNLHLIDRLQMVLYPRPLQHVAVTQLCLPLFLKGLAADVAFNDLLQPVLRILLFDKLAIEFLVIQRLYDIVITAVVQPDSDVNILDWLNADTPVDYLLLIVNTGAGISLIDLLNQSLTQFVSH